MSASLPYLEDINRPAVEKKAMDQNKEVVRKLVALIAFIAIAASVLFFAPPASRLFVALIALPIESLILVTLFSDDNRRSVS